MNVVMPFLKMVGMASTIDIMSLEDEDMRMRLLWFMNSVLLCYVLMQGKVVPPFRIIHRSRDAL